MFLGSWPHRHSGKGGTKSGTFSVHRRCQGANPLKELFDGGWRICAVGYPAEYRNSGIITFVVDKDGVVYQKDLGEKTVELAQAMAEHDPVMTGSQRSSLDCAE
jgi:hypothetical protein